MRFSNLFLFFFLWLLVCLALAGEWEGIIPLLVITLILSGVYWLASKTGSSSDDYSGRD